MRYLYTFILSVLVLAVAAQEQVKKGTLSGVVTAADTGESLQTAALQLLALPDTIYKSGVATDVHGGFSLVAPVGSYILRATYVGYLTSDKKVTIAEGKNTNIGKLVLSPDVVLLKGAEVTAEVPPITVSEDTTVYNTAAFRVPAGSMLEELIKKYPGVEISDDGTIKINGKTVSRILMKGKDFFGTDKDMALKNIPVDVVDKVKFYDKKSDFARITGIDDGEEETVLDLQMRRDVEEGIFANADLGYGTKDRYSAKGMANYFTDTQRTLSSCRPITPTTAVCRAVVVAAVLIMPRWVVLILLQETIPWNLAVMCALTITTATQEAIPRVSVLWWAMPRTSSATATAPALGTLWA